jgi:hypothetical protein
VCCLILLTDVQGSAIAISLQPSQRPDIYSQVNRMFMRQAIGV